MGRHEKVLVTNSLLVIPDAKQSEAIRKSSGEMDSGFALPRAPE
jgi:hypothetical protein